MARKKHTLTTEAVSDPDYQGVLTGISELLEHARRGAARAVNKLMTATYWRIGQRIVVYEQRGRHRLATAKPSSNAWRPTSRPDTVAGSPSGISA